jgi:hypothetical protein
MPTGPKGEKRLLTFRATGGDRLAVSAARDVPPAGRRDRHPRRRLRPNGATHARGRPGGRVSCWSRSAAFPGRKNLTNIVRVISPARVS